MNLKESENSVSIISGADGPTGVYIADNESKKSLKGIIKNHIYKLKQEKAKKKIFAGVHTIEEVVAYAMKNYGAVEVNTTERQYEEQRKALKESLVIEKKSELLGEMKDIPIPDLSNEDETREFLEKLEIRSEIISKIPENEMPMDFHLYEINIGEGRLEIEIDNIWNVFSVSCSGSKKDMKHLNKIMQDLYLYYGVSEKDIREKSDRYLSLINALTI